MKIIELPESQIKMVIPLFNAYRMFYGKASEIEASEDFIRNRIRNRESIIFLSIDESESEGVGFVQLYPSFTSIGLGKILVLNDLYVNPKYRRAGIARALLETVCCYAIKNNFMRITLKTATLNAQAQTLYESLDYHHEQDFLTYNLELPQTTLAS